MTCTVMVPQGGSTISSPLHFSCAYTSASTVTLAGLPFVPANESFLLLEEVTVQGTVMVWPSKNFKYSFVSATGVLTIAGATLASTSTFRLHIASMNLGYDSSTNTYGCTESDPIDSHVAWESLLNATGIVAGTVFYPSSAGLSLQGYKSFALFLVTTVGLTTTVEVQLDPTLTDWVDITRSGDDLVTGTSGAANYIDCTALLQWADLNAAFIRIKSVSAAGGSTAQYDVRRRAL